MTFQGIILSRLSTVPFALTISCLVLHPPLLLSRREVFRQEVRANLDLSSVKVRHVAVSLPFGWLLSPLKRPCIRALVFFARQPSITA